MKRAVLVGEMPKSCYECPFVSSGENPECMALIFNTRTHYITSYEYWNDKRADICPLRELPIPHGDLDEYWEGADYVDGFNECLKEVTGKEDWLADEVAKLIMEEKNEKR